LRKDAKSDATLCYRKASSQQAETIPQNWNSLTHSYRSLSSNTEITGKTFIED